MEVTYPVTLIVQIISAAFFSYLMAYYSKKYYQSYLFHWAYATICLTVFLTSCLLDYGLKKQGFHFNSLPSLFIKFVLVLSGYCQIFFLYLGTYIFLRRKPPQTSVISFIAILFLALTLFATFYDIDSSSEYSNRVRYFLSFGIRYLLCGIAFVITAWLIDKADKGHYLGKRITIISAFFYGLQMLVVGVAITEYSIVGSSSSLHILINIHGIVEIMLYSFWGIGMVMWLIDLETARSQSVSSMMYNSNDSQKFATLDELESQFLQKDRRQKLEGNLLVMFGLNTKIEERILQHELGSHYMEELTRKVKMAFPDLPYLGQLRKLSFVAMGNSDQCSPDTLLELRDFLSQPTTIDDISFQADFYSGVVRIAASMSFEDVLYYGCYSLQSAIDGKEKIVMYENISSQIQ